MYLKASEQALPVLHKGDTLTVTRTNITSGKTKAPARFTEATLLSAMENPVRYMSSDDNKMKKTLGETGGLGTVASGISPGRFEKTGAYRFLGNGTCQDCQRSTQRTGIYQRYRKLHQRINSGYQDFRRNFPSR